MHVEALMKAVRRAEVLQEIAAGKMTSREAAQLMKLCVRQVRRLRRKLEQGGVVGLCFQRFNRSPQRGGFKQVQKFLRRSEFSRKFQYFLAR